MNSGSNERWVIIGTLRQGQDQARQVECPGSLRQAGIRKPQAILLVKDKGWWFYRAESKQRLEPGQVNTGKKCCRVSMKANRVWQKVPGVKLYIYSMYCLD